MRSEEKGPLGGERHHDLQSWCHSGVTDRGWKSSRPSSSCEVKFSLVGLCCLKFRYSVLLENGAYTTHVHLNTHSHAHTHTLELISVIMLTVDVFFQNQFKIFKPFEIFADFTRIFVTMFYKRFIKYLLLFFDSFETILHLHILFNLHVTFQESLC